MSTHLPGFRSFSSFFASFCIGQISLQQHKGEVEPILFRQELHIKTHNRTIVCDIENILVTNEYHN